MTGCPAFSVPSFFAEVLALAYTGRVALTTTASTVSMVTEPFPVAMEPEPASSPLPLELSPSGRKGSESLSELPLPALCRQDRKV